MDRNDKFEQHKNLIYYVLHKYYPGYKDSYDELYQVGVLGLLNAISNYDEDQSKFSTYAIQAIKREIWKFLIVEKNGKRYNSELFYINKIIKENRDSLSEKELFLRCREEYPRLELELFKRIYHGITSIESKYEDEEIDIEDTTRLEDDFISNESYRDIVSIINDVLSGEGDRDKEITIQNKYN